MSCSKKSGSSCFNSYGKEISQLRSVETFTSLEVNDKVLVKLKLGTTQHVEVVAGENVIRNIKTTVSDGVLKIEDRNTCSFVRGYKHTVSINIVVPYIVKVTNNGVSNVYLSEINQDSILLRAGNTGDIYVDGNLKIIKSSSHGNGDVYLSGFAEQLAVYSNGENFFNSTNLKVRDYIFVANLSLGNCDINADGTGLVQYTIESKGNVRFSGRPSAINGSIKEGAKGQLIDLN